MEGGLVDYMCIRSIPGRTRAQCLPLGEEVAGDRVGRRHTFPSVLLEVHHASHLKAFYLERFQVSDYSSVGGLWLDERKNFLEGDRDLKRCWQSGLQHFSAGAL